MNRKYCKPYYLKDLRCFPGWSEKMDENIDRKTTDLSQAAFDQGTGIAHVEGTLTLNYVKVRCIADIHLVQVGIK